MRNNIIFGILGFFFLFNSANLVAADPGTFDQCISDALDGWDGCMLSCSSEEQIARCDQNFWDAVNKCIKDFTPVYPRNPIFPEDE